MGRGKWKENLDRLIPHPRVYHCDPDISHWHPR